LITMSASLVFFAILLLISGSKSEFEFCGVNEAGMESGNVYPGVANTNYATIRTSSIDYFASTGMNVIRLPFKWERIQGTLMGELDRTYLNLLNTTVQYITKTKNMFVLLDMHNYARYRGVVLGPGVNSTSYAAFYDVWYRIASAYRGNDKVIFGLMNEPHSMPTKDVVDFQNMGIKGVRDAGATQYITVCGNSYSGVASWGSSNDDYMVNITDPLNHFMFEMHQYFDTYSTGARPCDPTFNVASKFRVATAWLRNNNKTAFLGEFGIEVNATCMAVFETALSFLKNNTDVWKGFTYWAAGPWWPSSYFYNIEPLANGTVRIQQAAINRIIPRVYDVTPAPIVAATTGSSSAASRTTGAPLARSTGLPSRSTGLPSRTTSRTTGLPSRTTGSPSRTTGLPRSTSSISQPLISGVDSSSSETPSIDVTSGSIIQPLSDPNNNSSSQISEGHRMEAISLTMLFMCAYLFI